VCFAFICSSFRKLDNHLDDIIKDPGKLVRDVAGYIFPQEAIDWVKHAFSVMQSNKEIKRFYEGCLFEDDGD
jgi:hypothetical protein